MAISCLAAPLAGLPTRRARRSSSSVDSGMSEKSIFESGICLTLLAIRLSRANDTDRVGFMNFPPRIDDEYDSSVQRSPQPFESEFLLGMGKILPIQRGTSLKTVAASSNETPCFS